MVIYPAIGGIVVVVIVVAIDVAREEMLYVLGDLTTINNRRTRYKTKPITPVILKNFRRLFLRFHISITAPWHYRNSLV